MLYRGNISISAGVPDGEIERNETENREEPQNEEDFENFKHP